MNKANITYTRNHLSEIIMRVREGETVLILDRHQPVARLEPVAGSGATGVSWQGDLVRRGLVRQSRERLDLKSLNALPFPTIRGDGDILDTLLSEREEGG